VLDVDGDALALWSAGGRLPLTLAGGPAYRLDFLEVRGDHRGGLVSAIALALIATRAAELGARRIVLGATAGAADFYRRQQAKEGAIPGWKPGADLLPFEFTPDLTDQLCEIARDAQEN
jgi:hypothetical protein